MNFAQITHYCLFKNALKIKALYNQKLPKTSNINAFWILMNPDKRMDPSPINIYLGKQHKNLRLTSMGQQRRRQTDFEKKTAKSSEIKQKSSKCVHTNFDKVFQRCKKANCLQEQSRIKEIKSKFMEI